MLVRDNKDIRLNQQIAKSIIKSSKKSLANKLIQDKKTKKINISHLKVKVGARNLNVNKSIIKLIAQQSKV